MDAIKMFNGKDFGGNKIKVERGGDNVINLSQKRERSPSRQVLTLIPTSKSTSVVNLNPNHEINLSKQVSLAGNAPGKNLKEEVKKTTDEGKKQKEETVVAKNENTQPKKSNLPEKKEEKKVEVGKEEVKVSAKEEEKEDNLMIEVEGSKFLKTADESKLHCIACDKEITKKGLKAHIISKTHKSLIQ